MKKTIKITAFILVLTLILSTVASALSWPTPRTDGLDMPFLPRDKYVTDQNPPDFRWQYIDGAKSYKLVVSKNEDLSVSVTGYTAGEETVKAYLPNDESYFAEFSFEITEDSAPEVAVTLNEAEYDGSEIATDVVVFDVSIAKTNIFYNTSLTDS